MKRQAAFTGKGKLLKGNLHTHSKRSDGGYEPEDVIKEYAERGYDFLAITDHRKYNLKNFAPETGMVIIPGMEFDNTLPTEYGFKCFHTVCIGPTENNGYSQDETMPSGKARDQIEYQSYLDEIHAKNNITIYNHPEWSGTTARDFDRQKGNFAMEIWNSGSDEWHGIDTDAAYGDELLGQGIKIFGIANDDMHFPPQMGRGWSMLNAEKNVDSILSSLREGAFYSSCGPEIYDFYVDGNKAYVECSPASKIRLHSDMHPTKIVRGGDGLITSAEFALDTWPGPYKYVRATVIDENGKHAWTNPIFLDEE